MLRRSFTAAIERNVDFTDGFVSEPYETGWAIEARWFVNVLAGAPDAEVEITAETSPDGLAWCAHEATPVTRTGPGLMTLPLANLGPWQRLVFRVRGAESVRGICYLTLKG